MPAVDRSPDAEAALAVNLKFTFSNRDLKWKEAAALHHDTTGRRVTETQFMKGVYGAKAQGHPPDYDPVLARRKVAR